MMGLVVKNVNKSFGDKHVVDNISFELKKSVLSLSQ